MRSTTSQHLDHRRLRRTLISNEVKIHARSPQFGGLFGGGNSDNGNSFKDRLDAIGDRIGDRIGDTFGGKAENAFDRFRERIGGGNNNGNGNGGNGNGNGGNGNGNGGNGNGNGNNNGGGAPADPVVPSPSPQPSAEPVNNAPAPSDGQPSPDPGNVGTGNGGANDSGNQNNSDAGQAGAQLSSSQTSRTTARVVGSSSTISRTSSLSAAISTTSQDTIPSSTLSSAPETFVALPTPGAADDRDVASPGLNPSGSVSKRGLSGGVIAAIVILTLLFALLLFIVLLRRRWVARRSERFGQWWTNRKRNSRTYGDNAGYPHEKQGSFEWSRDEFGTRSGDRAASPLDLTNIVPTAPPVAEVRRLRNGSDAHLVEPSISDRFSIGSGDSFVVQVSHRASGTESFKFPKPPSHSDLATASVHSRFGSSASGAASVVAACGHTPLRSQPSSLGSHPPLTPTTVRRSPDVSVEGIPNPFADNDGSESIHNPFCNNSISISPLPIAVGHLSGVEKIRRPFHPSMKDELGVDVDEEVTILQIFDDGWAMVEQIGPNAKQGLIPLACLQDVGQDLTSLLTTKRVQSIHVSNQITE